MSNLGNYYTVKIVSFMYLIVKYKVQSEQGKVNSSRCTVSNDMYTYNSAKCTVHSNDMY